MKIEDAYIGQKVGYFSDDFIIIGIIVDFEFFLNTQCVWIQSKYGKELYPLEILLGTLL